MNKYVIELRPDCKVVQQICESNGQVCVGARSIQYLEELNSDYINEHFGSLQDDAYQKGFEDGKAFHEKGCEGCEYEEVVGLRCRCCANRYPNQWTAKSDKIEVRDEVVWTEDENVVIVVTSVYTADNTEWCDGVCKDGKVYSILTEHARKTGRRFDIQKILEALRE